MDVHMLNEAPIVAPWHRIEDADGGVVWLRSVATPDGSGTVFQESRVDPATHPIMKALFS